MVASTEGCSIHWIHAAGAPAATAASRRIFAAATDDCCADGWNPKMIGLRAFAQINDLNMVVDVGFVTGVTPATIPTGSATST